MADQDVTSAAAGTPARQTGNGRGWLMRSETRDLDALASVTRSAQGDVVMAMRILLVVSVSVMWFGIWRDILPLMCLGGAAFITFEVLKFRSSRKEIR